MNHIPKVSVIIPAYNSARYITRSIESFLNQTMNDIEIICVDDGSTDNTAEIVKAIGSTKIKLISQTNQGAPAARNTGLANAVGETIYFCDSDDFIHPRTFELAYKILASSDSVDAVMLDMQVIGNEEPVAFVECDEFHTSTNTSSSALEKFCKDKEKCSVCRWIYRHSIIKGRKFKNGLIGEDLLWTYELLKTLHRYVKIELPLYYYVETPSSITRSPYSAKKINAIYDMLERLFDYYSDSLPQREILCRNIIRSEITNSWKFAKRAADKDILVPLVAKQTYLFYKKKIIQFKYLPSLSKKLKLLMIIWKASFYK